MHPWLIGGSHGTASVASFMVRVDRHGWVESAVTVVALPTASAIAAVLIFVTATSRTRSHRTTAQDPQRIGLSSGVTVHVPSELVMKRAMAPAVKAVNGRDSWLSSVGFWLTVSRSRGSVGQREPRGRIRG